CYASVSWGKDSVAMAHLVLRSAASVPLVYVRAVPHGNPENMMVRDVFGPRDYREVIADYRGITGSADEIEKAKDRIFFAAFNEFGNRHISGIRADESG